MSFDFILKLCDTTGLALIGYVFFLYFRLSDKIDKNKKESDDKISKMYEILDEKLTNKFDMISEQINGLYRHISKLAK